uniref:Uncharacterized protein n=1 Tax=Salarias fasciatus TaxID=181472 RepID=A0A672IB51_SALFA
MLNFSPKCPLLCMNIQPGLQETRDGLRERKGRSEGGQQPAYVAEQSGRTTQTPPSYYFILFFSRRGV